MKNKIFTHDFQDETLNNKYVKTNKFTFYLILGLISLALVDHSITSYFFKDYFPAFLDGFTLIIYTISYILRIKNKFSQKVAGAIVVYGMILNICTLDVYYMNQTTQTLSTNFLYSLLL